MDNPNLKRYGSNSVQNGIFQYNSQLPDEITHAVVSSVSLTLTDTLGIFSVVPLCIFFWLLNVIVFFFRLSIIWCISMYFFPLMEVNEHLIKVAKHPVSPATDTPAAFEVRRFRISVVRPNIYKYAYNQRHWREI